MLHAQECLYIGREEKQRGVRPRLLDWLIPIPFYIKNGGNNFLKKMLCSFESLHRIEMPKNRN
jgi:hypothetical protein